MPETTPMTMSIVSCDNATCPRCDSRITPAAMERRPLPPERLTDWPRHHLLAWCHHCDSLWCVTRVMAPNAGFEIEAVDEITDPRVKRPFVRAIERKHGGTMPAA